MKDRDLETTEEEIERVKYSFLARIKANTKFGNIFSYPHYAKYFKVATYTLKMIVKQLISEGVPIISVKRNDIIGLVVCVTIEELDSYVENIEYKMDRMQEKINNIRESYYNNINN